MSMLVEDVSFFLLRTLRMLIAKCSGQFLIPRDHNTCPFSPWTITWYVSIPRISEEES